MTWLEALLLGLLQGLTEFLPVSSSGHIEIGKAIFGIDTKDDLLFTVVVHGATVLSTIIVFWKDIVSLFAGLFKWKITGDTTANSLRPLSLNSSTSYILKILISCIPVIIIGLFFKDKVEALFGSGLTLVGIMLLITALLLTLAQFLASGKHNIRYKDAFIIGLAQAIAVLPGLSRSGTTIATGLLIGNKREEIARFSFLMVLIPIIGENILELFGGEFAASGIGITPLLVGFMAAFISGLLACKFMINIVKKGKLFYFAIYCLVVGVLVLVF
ncbi:MAG: undecaprenyl-diphosphate phosphatase [Bacteroidales bacterium]|jgi:undecaprenyl-diphosphatase|nr:undecaprenyl-diphosphate phosphatase [Bacteroidales bacterium]